MPDFTNVVLHHANSAVIGQTHATMSRLHFTSKANGGGDFCFDNSSIFPPLTVNAIYLNILHLNIYHNISK